MTLLGLRVSASAEFIAEFDNFRGFETRDANSVHVSSTSWQLSGEGMLSKDRIAVGKIGLP